MFCSKAEAESMISAYIGTLETTITDVRQEFSEMDFENASALTALEVVMEEIISECNTLIYNLGKYAFEQEVVQSTASAY